MQSYQKQKEIQNTGADKTAEGDERETISNECVLNVAFWTFIGFTALEAVFAIIAGSQAMLEDAEAMSVDAFTYLFNLCAERIKHRPYTGKELDMPPAVRVYKRELLRLYLELIPPLISVSTLIAVTVIAMRDALHSLYQDDDMPENDVNVNLMMLFSGLNLLLDIVNVHYFAKAGQAFGLTTVNREKDPTNYSIRDARNLDEMEHLLGGLGRVEEEPVDEEESEGDLFLNLNMCSAWTHVCADTMRSLAVLIAASISYFFEDYLSGATADSLAAIVVSVIVLISLLPLFHGLYITARKIITLSTDPTRPMY